MRVAVLRLSVKDPSETLMTWAEEKTSSKRLRELSLRSLCDYDYAQLTPRIMKVYACGRNSVGRWECIQLLKSQKLNGITEAMIEDAISRDPGVGMDSGEYDLLGVLNERMHSSHKSLAKLLASLGKTQILADR